jgi:transposase
MARGDLTERQWQRLAPLLPPLKSGKRGHPYNDHRPVINGILWVLRTGASWQDLPERYGPAKTCFDRFNRWRRSGLWDRILQTLQAEADAAGDLIWEQVSVDASSVRAHQHAAGARHRPSKADEKRGSRRLLAKRSARAGAAGRPSST